jgi:Tfp pilus assembly protein PilF
MTRHSRRAPLPFAIAVRRLKLQGPALLGLVGLIVAMSAWLIMEGLAEWHFQAARGAIERFDYAAARSHLKTCLWLRPESFSFRFLAAQTARRAGLYQEALDHLNRCRPSAGGQADVTSLERVLLRVQQGNVAEVDQVLWALVRQDHPEKLLILEALARGYLQAYCLPLANECLKLLLEEQPDHAEAWLWKAGIYELLGNPGETWDYYERALALQPDNDTFRLRLALFLLDRNNAPEALPHLQQLCERQPDNVDALVGLARALIETGKPRPGRELLARALDRQPGHPLGLAEKGKLDLAAGQFGSAEDSFRKALAADPSDRAIHYLLFQCLERAGKKEAARKEKARMDLLANDLQRLDVLLREDLPKNPRKASLYHELGAIFVRQGNAARGRHWFQHALTIDPNHLASHQELARCYQESGQADRAAFHRDKARQLSSANVRVRP